MKPELCVVKTGDCMWSGGKRKGWKLV